MTVLATDRTSEHITRFRADFPHYARVNLRIQTKTEGLQPLVLNRAQSVVQAKAAEQKARTGRIRILILKARQEGISTWVAARIFRSMHLWQWNRALVLADLKKRSEELFGIYDRYYDQLPEDFRPRKDYASRGQSMKLANGSSLLVDTAKDVQAGRSITLHRIHASEIAFWEHPEDTFTSLMQAASATSEVFIESTANGVGNFFHRLWEDAVAGNNEWLPIFLPWFIHEEYASEPTDLEIQEILESKDPYERKAQDQGFEFEGETWKLDPCQLLWRRRQISTELAGDERKFRQEYPTTADEAFLVSGNAFFDEDALERYRGSARPPIARGNLVQTPSGGVAFVPAERGYLRVWEWPISERPCAVCSGSGRDREMPCASCSGRGSHPTKYVIAGDTAEGKEVSPRETEQGGRDFNSGDVFEITGRRFVAQLHGRMAPEVFAAELQRLGFFYSSPGAERQRTTREASLIGVERNHSSGQTVLSKLRDVYHYPRLFFHQMINRRNMQLSQHLGWITNEETRPLMLDELSEQLRFDKVDYPNPEGIREMRTFIRNEAGKPEAQEGCHDDRVISAAIAIQLAKYTPAPRHEDFDHEPEVADTPTGL